MTDPDSFSVPDPEAEPYKVLLLRDMLVDEAREGREIPIKTYYPSNYRECNPGGDKLPVIIWSHGLGGSRDGASFISRYLASHGYVVVHMQHRGTDSLLWEGKKGHPWDIIRNTTIPRSATLNRFYDVPFLLDQLSAWFEAREEVNDIADLSCLGMSGHSFGAMTTQAMLGMMFPDESGKLRSFKEPRFKAGILYSPVPIQHVALDDPEDIYGSIDRPLFFMTGTDDDSPVEGFGYEQRLVVHEHSGHDDKQLLVLDGGDHMIYNGSRGKLGQHPNRAQHEIVIKTSALIYWDAYLKNDEAAKAWLEAKNHETHWPEFVVGS